MLSTERTNLFDLIGRVWASDETQDVVSSYDGLKVLDLDDWGIYNFLGSGVKILTDKTGGGNEISEIYIYKTAQSVDRVLAKMPCDLRIGQPQGQVRVLLGEPYDAHLGHTYPPPIIPGGMCVLPRREEGWDIYHSSQLTDRLKIQPLKPFLLTVQYPLDRDYIDIRNTENKILLLVSKCQQIGKMILKKWSGDLPPKSGISSIEGILEHDNWQRSIYQDWEV